ncbi:MAG TPA: amidohydrolase family protein [Bryobacteraceae bacterium]|jgi:imidazolonepropionase-like amidohydrolase|nr:amidohydrolase family protein [Bryobacteraceae bacterium]
MKLLAILLVVLPFVAAAGEHSGVLRCGHLLDVRSGKEIPDAVVIYDNGAIVAAGPASAVPIPGKAVVTDLSAHTCLPGLIDVHDHLTTDPTDAGYEGLSISVPRSALKGAKNALITLRAGFTSVRNVGADGYSDVALRDAIEAGDVDGPRLLVSGPALGITGGHCDENLLAPEFHFRAESVADGPWAARAKVREVVKYGADLIKICASGGVLSKGDDPGTEQYTLEEMKAIADEAHKLGRKVAAHAHGAQAIKDAILAGIDSVEHASLIDAEGIALAKAHGTYLVFDVYNDDYILQEGEKAGMLPESIAKEKKLGKIQRENFRRAVEAGEKMAFGTDGGVYPHGDNAKQFPIMVEFGMKPIDAIRAATLNAADLMGWGGKAGAVEPGRWADIIAVDGDPLQDVHCLQRVRFVLKGGDIYRDDR